MKIIFVRHGHPNYQLDCLTELGHPQAEAAALIEFIERAKNGRRNASDHGAEKAISEVVVKQYKIDSALRYIGNVFCGEFNEVLIGRTYKFMKLGSVY